MCSMWVYVFNVFFVGLTRLHRGAKPSSVMVSFYLNLVIPVFLVNLLILQDVVILLNLVILLKKTQGSFWWTHPSPKLTMTIFLFF